MPSSPQFAVAGLRFGLLAFSTMRAGPALPCARASRSCYGLIGMQALSWEGARSKRPRASSPLPKAGARSSSLYGPRTVLKSELRLRPVWHQYSGRVQAHVFVCVLAYGLWKTLDHLAKQAGLMTLIHKPAERRYGRAVPKPRPMTPKVILRELGRLQIGDIILETTDGRQLLLRRVERPDAQQKRILAALKMELPERLSPDRLL